MTLRLRSSSVVVWLALAALATACGRTHGSPAGSTVSNGAVARASDTSGTSDTTDAGDAAETGDVTDAGVVTDSTASRLDRLRSTLARAASAIGLGARAHRPPPYAGTDPRGIPNYARRPFTDRERRLLRDVYGIQDPRRLYVSDSTEDGLLKYDTRAKRCRTCYVNSYRVGFVSVRRPGETWEQVERRVRSMRPRDFTPAVRAPGSRSTVDLDPDIRADVERMLADARRAGFVLRVVGTYRSPERQAYLMARGGRQTHTLTSLHSYGRAIDVIVGDGKLSRKATRAQWVAFRRWVTTYKGDAFRIIGTPERTWDWRHVEVPTGAVGFRTIEAALERAAACAERVRTTSRTTGSPCDFAPNLPASVTRPTR